MAVVVGSIALVAVLLCLAHYAAVAWPTIANRGDIARPLRLDRADSFGRWFVGMLMIGSAGASFLIYQLRRHRLDDFSGQYRLWRLVLIVMFLASLNSVVSLVDWSGALLDASIGKRVALAGSDWIRIVVSLGSAVLALRLIAEVRHSRAALVAMLAAVGFLAIPEAVKWNVMQVETIGRWALVTSAPLLAFTSLFLSFGIYLRMLYREVRRLDQTDSLKDRFEQMKLRVFQRSDEAEEQEQEEEVEPRRGWFRRRPDDVVEEANEQKEREEEAEEPERKSVTQKNDPDDDIEPKPKRRWFGLRAAKSEPSEDDESKDVSDVESKDPRPAKKKKRRFSLRLDPSANQQSAEPEPEPEASEETKPKRKFGLGAFRRQRAEQTEAAQEAAASAESQSSGQRRKDAADNDYIDPDTIDWNGLNKSERRRLKKQLRRQSRAA
jgi:hypothetical protein